MPFELDAPPAGAWHEERPTDPDLPSGLDPVLLEGSIRELVSAATSTRANRPFTARAHAREALQKLLLALGKDERASLLDRLIEDSEPLVSPDRDNRITEAP